VSGAIEHRVVSWTVIKDIGCGHHACQCGVVTPRPSDYEVIAFAKAHPGQAFMWPGSDWVPEGWTRNRGLLCPDCSDAVDAALAGQRKARR
jgi:hypothetical protein